MAELPAMMLWTDAYLGDTRHLSTLEHGAYLLILITMWRSGGSLRDDDEELARITGLRPVDWRRIGPKIRRLLTPLDDGTITQRRLQKELNHVRSRLIKNKSRASLGGLAKALKKQEGTYALSSSQALLNGCLKHANHNHIRNSSSTPTAVGGGTTVGQRDRKLGSTRTLAEVLQGWKGEPEKQ